MPNRLAREVSPYLLQHAHNPVDWYPWGEEALAKARAEDKPILLSIGYSACHWCHVMERESFEDPETARLMNELFVPVKVDREERPDLDQIYQLVVQLMGRSGGWPLTVFLAPDQKPFFGGTYFPPEPRYGMPSFRMVLQALAEAYRERRDEVDAQSDELTRAIAEVVRERAEGSAAVLGPDLLARAAGKLVARVDPEHGGLGSRPKFPNTMALDVLLRRGALEGDEACTAAFTRALQGMASGGIHDHLGGGFHRYSVDERWLVPHFEKMLYDNALLLRSYVDGWRVTGDARWPEVARRIVAWLEREMTSQRGAFYASQDADSEGEEGKFFVWTRGEIERALASDPDAARAFCLRYGVTDEGNFEETGANVLHEAKSVGNVALAVGSSAGAVAAAIERARAALFALREGRPRPFRDEKVLTSWSSLAIGALADAGLALGEPRWIAMAERALGAIADALVEGTGDTCIVHRLEKDGARRGPGFLDDYAYLADAALDVWEATGDPAPAELAIRVGRAMVARFHGEGGRFFFTPDGGESLIVRASDSTDHAVPSGTAAACRALLRLGALQGEAVARPATEALEALAASALENPFAYGHAIGSLDRLRRGSVDVVIVGPRSDERASALAREAARAYLPNRTIARVDPADPRSRAVCTELAEGKPAGPDGAPRAYVCRGRACSAPVGSPAELAELLQREKNA